MGPSQGNFWRSGLSGRPGRANASWSCGERQWLSVLSGIQDAASASVYCEMCALPGDMDLGNYLLAWKRVCWFCAVISVQVLTVKEREKDWLWKKKITKEKKNLRTITVKARERKWFFIEMQNNLGALVSVWAHLISLLLRDSLLKTESRKADGINVIENRKHLAFSVWKINLILQKEKKRFKKILGSGVLSLLLWWEHIWLQGTKFRSRLIFFGAGSSNS